MKNCNKENGSMVSSGFTSPTRMHKQQEERMQLQDLNGRLEYYIQKMREVENENKNMTEDYEVVKEQRKMEMNNVRKLYETQLKQTKEQWEDQNRQLQARLNQMEVEYESMKILLAEKERHIQGLSMEIEEELKTVKNEIKELYNGKLIQLNKKHEMDQEMNRQLTQENEVFLKKMIEMEQSMQEMGVLLKEKDLIIEVVQKKEAFITSKEKYILEKERECNELMEVNAALEEEIRKYHTLLLEEEERLNLKSPQRLVYNHIPYQTRKERLRRMKFKKISVLYYDETVENYILEC